MCSPQFSRKTEGGIPLIYLFKQTSSLIPIRKILLMKITICKIRAIWLMQQNIPAVFSSFLLDHRKYVLPVLITETIPSLLTIILKDFAIDSETSYYCFVYDSCSMACRFRSFCWTSEKQAAAKRLGFFKWLLTVWW